MVKLRRGACAPGIRNLAFLLLAALSAACSHTFVGPDRGSPAPAPAWTDGATCYEVFVRSFQDSNGDGIGDLKGLIARLDYINDGTGAAGAATGTRTAAALAAGRSAAAPGSSAPRSLGARCIWLMPIMPSPSYHGYDITDYFHVNPQYGTDDDFRRLVAEAHRRGVRVLVDMVLNHTSNEHPAFKAALADTTSPYRAWYRFSPTPLQAAGPWGQEVWHRSPLRNEYYYGIFWYGMPDLNYDHASTREEAKRIATWWLKDMGADGFRLDAVPYLVEEGNQLRDTPGTHAFLREYAAHVRAVAPDAFTVGEVWDSIGLMLTYYPLQLDSYFSFALAADLLRTAGTGSARGLLDDYLRLQTALPAGNYSPFLSNHDQTRVATALRGDPAREKLAATLLLTLPGIPFVYFGEEIGMKGDKPDEQIRTPMQWSAAPGAGFTTGTPWEPLQPDWSSVNVAAQDADSASLLNLYRRLIHLRAATPALATGALVPLATGSDAIVAYLRRAPAGSEASAGGAHPVLVVANLGTSAIDGVALSSVAGALPSGDYAAAALLGGPAGATLHVDAGGRVAGWVPLPTLAPLAAHVLELQPAAP